MVEYHKQKLRLSQVDIHGGDNVNQQKGNSIDLPVNVKVYELYS
ncbi:MAG: hypothetical protein WCA61_08575 [Nitrososphaeraceae archaeon]